jgi:LysR family hydrogen peroxide-inducible transcriptional activator
MNLRDLHYLITLAETLHFGKAADICNVSQSTLSVQIKKLEESLGVQIFERYNKQVLLTPVGAEMVAIAQAIIHDVTRMKNTAAMHKNPFAGTLKLGAFPSLAPYLFPVIIPRLKAQLPALELLLTEEKTEQLLALLHKGELDAAFIALPVPEDVNLSVEPLFRDSFLLAVPSSHRLADRRHVALEELQDETMLLLDEGHCLREQALEVCSRIGKGASSAYRATSLETLRNMVASGAGVTLFPQIAIGETESFVQYVPISAPTPHRTIALVWRTSSGRDALMARVGDVVVGDF